MATHGLIHHMKDTGATSAPTDFLNRASWNQMFPPPSGSYGIMDETEGEGGIGSGGGIGGGGGNNDEEGHNSSGTSDRRPFLTLMGRHKGLEAAVVLGGLHILRHLVWISWARRKKGKLGSGTSSNACYLNWDCFLHRWRKKIVM